VEESDAKESGVMGEETMKRTAAKDKYTKEFANVDLPDDRKEILLESIDALARDHSVSDYEKLKFDGVLTPTERYLWTSLFKYIHDYGISLDDFKAIVESALNLQAIDCRNSNPSDLLDVMIENMRRISPGILNIKDSYKQDDKRMLEMMKGFNAYDDMCMVYFYKKENQTAIDEYNALMGTECKTIEDGVQQGFFTFFTKLDVQ